MGKVCWEQKVASSALSTMSLSLTRIGSLLIHDKLLGGAGRRGNGGKGSGGAKARRLSNGPQTKESSMKALSSLSLSSSSSADTETGLVVSG